MKTRKKQEVASSHARDARGEGVTASTRRAQHRNKAPERGPPGGQTKGSTTHHGTHRTDTTHTARGQRAPAARPKGGQPGKGDHLNPDAPHHHRGVQPPTWQASDRASAGPPHPDTRAHSTWVADPGSPPRGRAGAGGGAPDLRHPSQRRMAPPPGDALPPRPQRATMARKGARCGAGAGSPRPREPQPGHTGRGTPAARPRAAGEGQGLTPEASQNGGRLPPPGDGPPPPSRHAAPTGHTNQGDSAGPPHLHTRAHSTSVADPDSPPKGRSVGGGGAPDLRRPSQRTPPGTPVGHPHSAQRPLARAHAVGLVLGRHAHTNRTRDTPVAEPRLPALADARSGEGQRLTPDAPHNGGRPSPPGIAPHHPSGTQPLQGMQAKGTVLGPHTRTPAPMARGLPTPTARPEGGQQGEGERLIAAAPHNGAGHPPHGDTLPPPPRSATTARKGARCGAGAGSPRPHQPHPGQTGRRTPAPRPRGRAAG